MNEDLQINETEGVNGGYPCVGNTRIAVRLVAEVFRKTDDVEKTAEKFPQLTHEQVVAAIDFYIKNPARINEDSERNRRTLIALSAR